tara:strand:+ start:75 stop:323 length:249 start_codon:yes stop_codon:yes gene_type:complete
MKHVVQLSGVLRDSAEGLESVEVEAETVRELLNWMLQRFPDLNEHMDEGIAVSIDGEIFRDTWGKHLPQGAEIMLLPRIAGG